MSDPTTPATPADIEARWQPLTDQQTIVAQTLLDDAWHAHLLRLRPTLPTDIDAGTVTAASVVWALCSMVLRVLKNPDGYVQEAIDDWSGRRSDTAAGGELYASVAELDAVTPTPVPTEGRRRSVRLVAYDSDVRP